MIDPDDYVKRRKFIKYYQTIVDEKHDTIHNVKVKGVPNVYVAILLMK